MKNFLFVTMIMTVSLIFTACKKSNDGATAHQSVTTNGQSGESSLSDILKAGSWMIDYYFDEEDKSSDFSGYVFTFMGDGGLTLKKGNESYTGKWQAVREEGVPKVMIEINTINIVQKLNDKWQVKTLNSAKLDMKNDNPARSEFLNIKKI